MSTPAINHHEKQRWTRTGWGNPCGMCAPIPASRQANESGFSASRLTHTSPNLPTSRPLRGVGTFSTSFASSGPLSIQAVPPAGAVAGVLLPLVTAAHSLPLLRRGSRLRHKPAKFAILCISHVLQDRADALHLTRVLSSAVEPSKGQHAAKVFGNVRKAVGRIRNV